LEAGGWRLEAGGWRLEAGGWRLEAGGWRLEAGGWRLETVALDELRRRIGSATISGFARTTSCPRRGNASGPA
jgi:hypothetical protein